MLLKHQEEPTGDSDYDSGPEEGQEGVGAHAVAGRNGGSGRTDHSTSLESDGGGAYSVG